MDQTTPSFFCVSFTFYAISGNEDNKGKTYIKMLKSDPSKITIKLKLSMHKK